MADINDRALVASVKRIIEDQLREKNTLARAIGRALEFVETHLDLSDEDLQKLISLAGYDIREYWDN